MLYLMGKDMLLKYETIRTTITFPVDLINRSQRFVDDGVVPNRNALMVAALEQFLLELERQEIDRQFEAMADDDAYQAMNEELVEEFAESDWEIFVENETG